MNSITELTSSEVIEISGGTFLGDINFASHKILRTVVFIGEEFLKGLGEQVSMFGLIGFTPLGLSVRKSNETEDA